MLENKQKNVLFVKKAQIVEYVRQQFEPDYCMDFEAEPLDNIQDWFIDTLSSLSQRYEITAISIAIHGGNFVGIDSRGNRIFL